MLRKVAIAACAILSFANLAFGQIDTKELELEYDSVDHWIACKAEIAKEIFVAEVDYRNLTFDDVYYELARIAQIAELEYWEESLSKIWSYCTTQDTLVDMTSDKFLETVKELVMNPQCLPSCDEVEELEKLFTN